MEASTFAADVVPVSPFDTLSQNVLSTYCFTIAGQLDATKMQQSFDKLVKEHWPIVGARLRKDPITGFPAYHVPKSFTDDLPTCAFEYEHIEGPEKWTLRQKTDIPSIQATYSKEVSMYLPGDRPATMDVYYNSNQPLFLIKMTTASKANVTYLSLTAPHIFNDAGGLTLLLEGWSSILKGQTNLVPPLLSTLPTESLNISKPVDEGTPGLWLAEPADLAGMLGTSKEGVEARDIFIPRSFISALRQDAMRELKARGVEDSFLSEGDCLWAWWTKLTFPARKDKHAKLNLGQPIDFRKNIPGLSNGEDVDAMPLHELAYTIRQSIVHHRKHPNDIQDQALLMAQISQGGKPYFNFDPKLDIAFFSNWLSVGFASPTIDFSPALKGSTASMEAGRIINTRFYSEDCSASTPLTYALCKNGDGDIWMMSYMHKDAWEHPRLKELTV